MNFSSRLVLMAGTMLALLIACPVTSAAESPFSSIAPYVDGQTFLIGRLDVKQLSLSDLKSRLPVLLTQITGDASVPPQFEQALGRAIQLRDGFLAAGGQDVFLIVSPADIPYRPPFLVVTATDAQKTAALETFVRELVQPDGNNMAMRQSGDRTILVGSPPTLERLAGLQPQPRPEVAAATSAIASAPIQLILVPNADQHRVLKETFPSFPPPWQQVTGPALSDGVQWGALTVVATPGIKAHLMVESKDAAAAAALKAMLDAALDAAVQLPAVQEIVPEAGQLRKLIAPTVAGKQVSITLTDDAATLQAVAKPLAAALQAARGNAQRQMSVNNLKQLALSMHVYHDQFKRFPPAASADAAGKPLLSWRVHILPYLEQEALYKQFKLDEPWDSEHNKKLIELMPPTFADPAVQLKPGMTTYVVPIGEGTVFGGKKEPRFQDILDGTSNTIMIVNVTPDRAVVWTKPEDLAVTEAAPLTGLVSTAQEVRNGFLRRKCADAERRRRPEDPLAVVQRQRWETR